MSDDVFHTLTQGAHFDRVKHGKMLKLFTQGTKSSMDLGSILSGTMPGSAASIKRFSEQRSGEFSPIDFTVASVPSSLSFFGGSAKGKKNRTSENQNTTRDDNASAKPKGHEEEEKDSHSKPLIPMSGKRMNNIWKKHHITVKCISNKTEPIPSPIEHFSNLLRPPLSAPKYLVNNLFSREHRIPTAVQMQVIPTLIAGRDAIVCAPTGSGKTLAYLIPMFARLKKPNPQAVGIRAIIVVPSMELAIQIEREIFLAMKGDRWRLVQHGQSTKGKDIMVTTPQRLLTMIEKELIDATQVEYLVFDEGDKLWDTASTFLEMVDKILSFCTCPTRVTSLFTATLSKKVENMCASVMRGDPVSIIVEDRTCSSKDVEQKLVFTTHERGKVLAMRDLINNGLQPPALVFVQNVDRTKELFDEINYSGLHCAIMNGKMTMVERDEIVLNFRLGKIWVLITTDLLARGIDFKNVQTVINYDFPQSAEAYVHRVGRTGRAHRKGIAITFFTEDDRERLPMIVGIISKSGSEIPQWMLDIKTSRSRLKQLAKETPHRNIINNKKARFLREKALDRELNAMKREKESAKNKKKIKKRKVEAFASREGGSDEEYEEVSDGELQE